MVGAFAALYIGGDTAANRQQVIDAQSLDDALFNPAGFTTGTLITSLGQYSGEGAGRSLDTGLGDVFGVYDYACCGPITRFDAANAIDDLWMRTSGVTGETVWDLARISHPPSAADAERRAVTGRTRSARLDIPSSMPASLCTACSPSRFPRPRDEHG